MSTSTGHAAGMCISHSTVHAGVVAVGVPRLQALRKKERHGRRGWQGLNVLHRTCCSKSLGRYVVSSIVFFRWQPDPEPSSKGRCKQNQDAPVNCLAMALKSDMVLMLCEVSMNEE